MSTDPFLIHDDGYGTLGHAINTNHWNGYDSGCLNRPFNPQGLPETLPELLLNAHDRGKSFYASGGTEKWKYVELTGAHAMGAEYLVIYHVSDPSHVPFALFRIEEDLRVTLIRCTARGFISSEEETSKTDKDSILRRNREQNENRLQKFVFILQLR